MGVELVGHYYITVSYLLNLKHSYSPKGQTKSKPSRVLGHCTVFNGKFYAADIDPFVTISSQLSTQITTEREHVTEHCLQCRN